MDVKSLYVQTQGTFDQQAIIFLHAFPLSSEMWKDQMHFFSKTHYTLAPDLPGFGKGTLPTHAIMFEYYVDSVLNFLKESGIKNSIWCGLSMGGYVALRLYEKAPELCHALILANTKAAADNNATKARRWGSIKNLHHHREDFVEKQWQKMVGKSSLENYKLKKQFFDILAKNNEWGISSALASLATRTDSTSMLSHIEVPTLIITSDEDRITTINDAEILHSGISKGHFALIKNAGHLSNMENPAEFNKVVLEFINMYCYNETSIELMN